MKPHEDYAPVIPTCRVISAWQLANVDPGARGIRLHHVVLLGERSPKYGYHNTGIRIVLTDMRRRQYTVTIEDNSALVPGPKTDRRGRELPALFRANRQGNLAALNLRPVVSESHAILLRLEQDGRIMEDRILAKKYQQFVKRRGGFSMRHPCGSITSTAILPMSVPVRMERTRKFSCVCEYPHREV